MRSATYLYGFVRADQALPDGLRGLDGAAVFPVAIDGIAAIVGELPPEPFESDAVADLAWLIPRALQHDRVVAELRQAGPVMPVRFGALFTTNGALRDWAGENAGPIGRFLESTADRDEWSIRLNLDLVRAVEGLAAVDPAWAARLAALPKSPGARYLAEKRLSDDARADARRRARIVAGLVRVAARGLGDEHILAPREAPAPGIEPVLNAAYLVPRRDADALRERAAAAALDLPCLILESSGPWAPSHFGPALSAPGP